MLLDIVVRLGLGAAGLLVVVFLYVAILGPIISKIGRLIYPDGDEAGQLYLGFLALLVVSICGIASWVLGDWLFDILQIAI